MKKFAPFLFLLVACSPAKTPAYDMNLMGQGANVSDCPLLKGEYQRKVTVNGQEETHQMSFDTIKVGNFFDYRLSRNGDYYRANSAPTRIDSGDAHGIVRVDCSVSNVHFQFIADGHAPIEMDIRVLNSQQIEVKADWDGKGDELETYTIVK